MMPISVDQFLSRLIGDADFRQAFFVDPLNTCAEDPSGLTWTDIAALLFINEPTIAEFARGTPDYGPNFGWKDDQTNRVALKSH